ncbi:hypothetical protein BDN67DRAFT_976669 [Paxillus ammoniavirescens]|nr:hypothetical protein BDN67DRAFT_976669 [Paxillus ammoniavirescens]
MTPPDGQNGYVHAVASTYPDGDMEAGMVIHKLAHGLSTRLTGRPQNFRRLGWGESGHMGEGWGDFIATSVHSTSTYSDYAMGAWASDHKGGIHNYVYSLDTPGYWEMLWVIQQRLIGTYSFPETLLPPTPNTNGSLPTNDFYRPQMFNPLTGQANPLIPKHSNTLLMQLVLDRMKLQPCSPSFFNARDAIIQADEILTRGENTCALWEGFVERGLGVDATVVGSTPWGGGVRQNGSKVPPKCGSTSPAPEPEPLPKPKPTPGNPDEDCRPLPWCWVKDHIEKWVLRLPWGLPWGYY